MMERLERRQLLSVYTVTSNADTIADDGVMTLREAVLDANAHANDAADPSGPIDKIVFNIPSGKTSDVQTISLGSGLKVTDAVVIDGYTQGDASRNTLPIGSDAKLRIQIAGDADPFDLLTLATGSSGSTVTGLALGGANGNGIVLASNGNFVFGNFIGVSANGSTPFAFTSQTSAAVYVTGGGNTIGSAAVGDRNVLNAPFAGINVAPSGNTLIFNNYIGVVAAGTAKLDTGSGIVMSASSASSIGDGTASGGNLISGCSGWGIILSDTSSTHVAGNHIGVAADETTPLGNGKGGIQISGLSNTNVIGGGPGAANVIANNTGTAVLIARNISDPQNNSVLSNSIYNNQGLAIDLSKTLAGDGVTPNDPLDTDAGPNALTNTPVLTSAVNSPDGSSQFTGEMHGLADTTYLIEIYDNAAASIQARYFMGSTTVQTDALGNADFTFTAVGKELTAGGFSTASATRLSSDGLNPLETSEFCEGIPNDDGVSAPRVPSGLVGRVLSNSQIKLDWTDNAKSETGFEVQYSKVYDFRNPTTVPVPGGANVHTFTVTGLSTSNWYYFRVRAVGRLNSPYTHSIKLKTFRNAPLLPTVTGFVMVDADTNQIVLGLADGQQLSKSGILASLGIKNFSIQAQVSGPVQSVRFGYQGKSNFKLQNIAPYSLFGDRGIGDYIGRPLSIGSYAVVATPFNNADAAGTAGALVTIHFTVVA